jgi:hypothetical protein
MPFKVGQRQKSISAGEGRLQRILESAVIWVQREKGDRGRAHELCGYALASRPSMHG